MRHFRVDGPVAGVALVDVGFPGAFMFANAHAVVRHEYHDGIAEQIQILDFLQYASHTPVHDVGFRQVVGPEIAQFRSGQITGPTIVGMQHGGPGIAAVIVFAHQILPEDPRVHAGQRSPPTGRRARAGSFLPAIPWRPWMCEKRKFPLRARSTGWSSGAGRADCASRK